MEGAFVAPACVGWPTQDSYFDGDLMANLVYKINVNSPCTGDQIVNKVAPTHYTGAAGDFTYAVLTRSPSSTTWRFTIYDYSGAPACFPNKTFEQITPNASDPAGTYKCLDAEGEALVSDFP